MRKLIILFLLISSPVLSKTWQEKFHHYDNNYITFGGDKDDLKIVNFQISAAMDTFDTKLPVDYFFNFTAKSLWEIQKESLPFYSTDYNFGSFLRTYYKGQSLDFSYFDHLSNGQLGSRDRSLNKSYIRANLNYKPFTMSFQYFYLWIGENVIMCGCKSGLSSKNKDIQDYISSYEFNFKVNFGQSFIEFKFGPGGGRNELDFKSGWQEVNIKIDTFVSNFFLFGQYRHGFMNIEDYSNRQHSFYIGLGI